MKNNSKKNWINEILSQGFVWMAVSGLFLVAWGLIVTPDEMQAGQELQTLSWRTTLEGPADQGSEYAWK